MPNITQYRTCPTCGQSLVDERMRKAVSRAIASTQGLLRKQLLPGVEAQVREELEGKYADDNARAWARAQALQHQLDRRGAHDRGVRREHDVMAMLNAAFPTDRIEHEGRRGDILQTVVHAGQEAGLILYECKNTATFQNKWLTKLRDDGRKRGTTYLVLVSSRLPAKEIGICVREDVAICEPTHAAAIASIIRRWVIEIQRLDSISRDASDKAGHLYEYLASDEFRSDFDGVLACSRDLDEQIAAERTYHDRIWERRDQIQERLRTASLMINANLTSRMQDANALGETDSPAGAIPSANGARHL